jgi:hypothetical protein
VAKAVISAFAPQGGPKSWDDVKALPATVEYDDTRANSGSKLLMMKPFADAFHLLLTDTRAMRFKTDFE